jgi:hypothetical protein
MQDASAAAERDAPFGRHVTILSSVTGRPLTYFIPHPITELSSRLSPSRQRPAASSSVAAWLLTPFMCRRDGQTSGAVEPAMIRAYARLMAGQIVISTKSDLIELAAGLEPQACQLRQQISYAGGRTPSAAQAIYAPASDLPTLMDSLAEFLKGDLEQKEASEVAALVSEYAIRVHPYVDGNGRWARLLTAYAGTRSGDLWAGVATAVFRKTGWDVARTTLDRASHYGLVPYFDAARRFSMALYASLDNRGLCANIEQFVALLNSVISLPIHRYRLLAEFLARGSLHEDILQRGLACSQKKAAGIANAVASLAIPWISKKSAELSCAALHEEVDKQISCVLRESK